MDTNNMNIATDDTADEAAPKAPTSIYAALGGEQADPPITFGRLLRAMREAHVWTPPGADGPQVGMTQRDLVAQANATQRMPGLVVTALSHWEDARRLPLPPQLHAILRVLKASPADTLALIYLGSGSHRLYGAIVSTWTGSGFDDTQKYQSWELWANSVPLRPPRGRSWEEEGDDPELPDLDDVENAENTQPTDD